MSTGSSGGADEDLTRHFRWRWNEHGITLGVCSTLGLFVLFLYFVPFPSGRDLSVECEWLRASLQKLPAIHEHETAVRKPGPTEQSGAGRHHVGSLHLLKGPADAASNSGILGILKAR